MCQYRQYSNFQSSVAPANFKAHQAKLAHHSAAINKSLAVQTGSCSNVLAKASREPYLSITACLPSGVATNLYTHFNVS